MVWRRAGWWVLLAAAWLAAGPALATAGALPRVQAPVATPAPDTLSAVGTPGAAPTLDRLAAPPTAANPNQADIGAQLFWQNCQPCHGDRAQGLTDEWRAQYPPDDQNCWTAGCHGDRPYAHGFTLPHTVPALVGPGSLGHFATAADLFTFMSQAMPFQAPGSLKPAEYWAITAFLLRGHGLPDSELPIADAAAARRVSLGAIPATTGVGAAAGNVAAAGTPSLAPALGQTLGAPVTLGVVAVAVLAVAGISWLAWRRSRGHG